VKLAVYVYAFLLWIQQGKIFVLATLNSSPTTLYFWENPGFNVNLPNLARLKSLGALAEKSSSRPMVGLF